MTARLERELAVAIAAARAAGEVLRSRFGTPYRVVRKSLHEMVAEVDMESQRVLVDRLTAAFPGDAILSEEISAGLSREGRVWIVDPLDGTHNYIAGLPFFGVSVALADETGLCLGVVYFPLEDELFHAVQGGGAYRNGVAVRVSSNDRLDKAVVAYDNQFHLSNRSLDNLRRLADAAFTVRIFGVASADMCLIASGRVDARVWNATKIVDVAAGSVIVGQAGGRVTDFVGRGCGLEVRRVVASNGLVHDQLLEALDR